MSKINLKTDYIDGQVLHGDELNVDNKVTMLGVNDNFDQIQKLSSNKADIVYVDNQMSSKVDLATLNTRLTEMDLKKADKAALATKADQSDLNKKANTVDVNNALATKADTSYVNSMLNTKASKSEVNDALAAKANQAEIGNLEDLKTDDKSSVVNAINSINREAIGIATTEKVGVVKPDGQTITIDQDGSIHAVGGGSGGGTTDYSLLSNKPQINDVELVGNLSLSDLGLLSKSEVNKALMDKADKTDVYTKEEVDTIAVIPLSNKADKSYVDTQLSNKANSDDVYTKSAVDTLLESETSNTDAKLLYKANTSDVYTKSQADALLNGKANNLTYNDNLLQLTSNGTPIGDAVKIESSSSSDIVISHDKPTDNDWKLWIDSGEVDNIGSEVVNTLDGAEVNKAPSVYAVNKALENIKTTVESIRFADYLESNITSIVSRTRKVNKRVVLEFSLSGNFAPNTNVKIATMPEGFRPNSHTYGTATFHTGSVNMFVGSITITSEGNVSVKSSGQASGVFATIVYDVD